MTTPNLDQFINYLEGQLRTGGGATLDELYDLAIALKADLQMKEEQQ